MTSARIPRVVIVTRPTELQALVAHHGTREQAAFYLQHQGQSIEELELRHRRFETALQTISAGIPIAWRRARIERADLAQFVFEPADVIVAVGQDGLVANVAKYLDEQPVIGVNPDPATYDGVLVPHAPRAAVALLPHVVEGRFQYEARTLVEAQLDDGQRLIALNEIFVGQITHQSARYRMIHGKVEERQSSSGIVVATGTGGTGWARSIHDERRDPIDLPRPTEPRLAYFVREAWPGLGYGTSLTQGVVEKSRDLLIFSEMNSGGVAFGDGIEEDRIAFNWGSLLKIGLAEKRLNLVGTSNRLPLKGLKEPTMRGSSGEP